MRKLLCYASGAICLSMMMVLIIIQFANPDRTATRLFLDYWYLYVLLSGSGLSFAYFLEDNS